MTVPGGEPCPAAAVAIAKAEAGETEQREFSADGAVEEKAGKGGKGSHTHESKCLYTQKKSNNHDCETVTGESV